MLPVICTFLKIKGEEFTDIFSLIANFAMLYFKIISILTPPWIGPGMRENIPEVLRIPSARS